MACHCSYVVLWYRRASIWQQLLAAAWPAKSNNRELLGWGPQKFLRGSDDAVTHEDDAEHGDESGANLGPSCSTEMASLSNSTKTAQVVAGDGSVAHGLHRSLQDSRQWWRRASECEYQGHCVHYRMLADRPRVSALRQPCQVLHLPGKSWKQGHAGQTWDMRFP